MPSSVQSGVLELYGEAVPEKFFEQVEKDLGLSARQRIFSLPLVVWLMISQRLDSKATLSTAVQQIVQQQPRALLSDHKRIREGRVSCHTGAYSDARQTMPLTVAEKVADRVLNHLLPTRRQALPGWDRPVFILDGSALEAPHTEELVEAFPPQPKSHWPALLVLVAQELTTGFAERPCWGPMHGPQSGERAILDRTAFGPAPQWLGGDGRHQLRGVFGSLCRSSARPRRAAADAAFPGWSNGPRLSVAAGTGPADMLAPQCL